VQAKGADIIALADPDGPAYTWSEEGMKRWHTYAAIIHSASVKYAATMVNKSKLLPKRLPPPNSLPPRSGPRPNLSPSQQAQVVLNQRILVLQSREAMLEEQLREVRVQLSSAKGQVAAQFEQQQQELERLHRTLLQQLR
jgi:hypothetical protein